MGVSTTGVRAGVPGAGSAGLQDRIVGRAVAALPPRLELLCFTPEASIPQGKSSSAMAEPTGEDQITLNAAEAAALGERALQRIGHDAEAARVVAAHLVESELCGYPALGLTRVLT